MNEPGLVAQVCTLSPLEVKARELQVQGLPGLQGEFKTSTGSLVEALSQNRKKGRKRRHEVEKERVKGWLGVYGVVVE